MRLTADALIEITPGPTEGELAISFTNPERNSFAEVILPVQAFNQLEVEISKFQRAQRKKALLQRLLNERLYWQLGATGPTSYVSSIEGRFYSCRWNPISCEYEIKDLHTGDMGTVRHWPQSWTLQLPR